MNNRREFIQKMGLFSALCMAGTNSLLAQSSFEENQNGIILRENEGEIFYIGNERKAKVTIKISKTSQYTPEMSLLTEVIVPNDGIPVHRHLNEEEFIFIQKGNLEIILGDKIQEGKSGDFIYVPRNVWHGFQNIHNKEAIIIFGYSPSGFEDYFRAIGTQKINDKLGFTEEDWISVNKKYGVVYRRN